MRGLGTKTEDPWEDGPSLDVDGEARAKFYRAAKIIVLTIALPCLAMTVVSFAWMFLMDLWLFGQILEWIYLGLCFLLMFFLSALLNFCHFRIDAATVAWACWSLAFLLRAVKPTNDEETDEEKDMLPSDKKVNESQLSRVFRRWIPWVLIGIVVIWIPVHLDVIRKSPVNIRKFVNNRRFPIDNHVLDPLYLTVLRSTVWVYYRWYDVIRLYKLPIHIMLSS